MLTPVSGYQAGIKIRELRRARKMSRAQLAVAADVSITTVNRVEQGTRVGLSSLASILSVLDPEARLIDYAD
jgi:transcriptional regulator with XRE-family HTH domain